MARKTVKVEIPASKPDDLIKLGQAILTKHTEEGANSPLDTKKMTTLAGQVGLAAQRNQDAKDADAVAQKARQDRDNALGMADGQNASTKDTALNLIMYARAQLLIANEGVEEALSAYGFDVQVGSAKAPQRKEKKQA